MIRLTEERQRRIEEASVGTELSYGVHAMSEEIARLKAEIARVKAESDQKGFLLAATATERDHLQAEVTRMTAERDEAREAARWLMKFNIVAPPLAETVKKLASWPWLKE